MNLSFLFEKILKEQDEVSLNSICNSIEDRNQVKLVYRKFKNGSWITDSSPRLIYPHRLYVNKSNGKMQLEAYQEQGDSKTEFKRFTIDNIISYKVLSSTFEVIPEYNSSGNKFASSIRCEI